MEVKSKSPAGYTSGDFFYVACKCFCYLSHFGRFLERRTSRDADFLIILIFLPDWRAIQCAPCILYGQRFRSELWC